jgi:hypothetical protein
LAAQVKWFWGQEVNHGGQALLDAMAPAKAYFSKVGEQVGQALRTPAAPVQSNFGTEANHGGQDF